MLICHELAFRDEEIMCLTIKSFRAHTMHHEVKVDVLRANQGIEGSLVLFV